MNRELRIRSYQRGDEIKILELFRHSFGHDLGPSYWTWRFGDNPAGAGMIDLCWDGGILAAHYAVSPVALRVNGRDYSSGLSGTTMTHSDYRGRGLFPLLAAKTYARMAAADLTLVWGFPNQFSHRSFIRHLDWKDVYEVPILRLMTAQGTSLPAPGDAVVDMDAFDVRFDRLWAAVRDDYRVIARRDRTQLSWRYSQNPQEEYRILGYVDHEELLGYAVFKRYHDEVQIIDILTRDDIAIGLQLIARVVQIARTESAQSVSLWLNVTHRLHPALEGAGFVNGEPVTYFGAKLLRADSGGPGEVVYSFRDWYLTMGDSDVF